MKKFSIIKPAFLFLFLLQLLLITAATSNPPVYHSTDSILSDCGSSGVTNSPDNRTWTGDVNSKFGPVGRSVVAKAGSQSSNVDQVPYMTARISQSQFMYTFPVTAGHKFIRLYFYPASYEGGFEKFHDFFTIEAGPFTLLKNFSASLHAEVMQPKSSYFLREFCLHVGEDQQLNLTFSPVQINHSSSTYAFINGVEILSMPSNLYYTPTNGSGLSFLGEKENFYVRNDTALEMMQRLNVGGQTISSTDDTGMYRIWESDHPNPDSLVNSEPSLSLIYSKIPNYTAPRGVYLSARQMQINRTNLTWIVPVDQGFKYLVRLHFCEFVLMINVNDRRFDIFLDNQIAKLGFDVLEASGGNRTPIYRDYIVKAGNKSENEIDDDDYKLSITLRPNNHSVYPDAFLNGMEIFKLNDSDGNLAVPNPLVSLPPPPVVSSVQPSPTGRKSDVKKKVLLAVIGGVIGLLIVLSLLGFVILWRSRKRNQHPPRSYYQSLSCCLRTNDTKRQSAMTKATSSLPKALCRQFSLIEVKAATENFHEKLIIGEGGFGSVYKGKIDDRDTVVAIKRLNPESRQGAHEFKTEIQMLSRLRHVHLAPLIGYCLEEGEMILVYQFMINGNLRQHLYETVNEPVPWKKRLEICVGAARGLHYLHAEVKPTVIHRDIKSTNILLDENWVAKVSDFGLSKIGGNDSAVSTIVKGTWGYLDPEYARRHQLTDKSDVYSFGVVLFEVLCARKPLNQKLDEGQRNLASWARKCIHGGTMHQIIDPFLIGKISPECFNKFVETADNCVRDNGIDRPSMQDVKEMLEFALELQEAADAEKGGINPGDENIYPHVPYTTTVGGSQFDSSSASGSKGMDSDTSTGMTFPSSVMSLPGISTVSSEEI